MDLGTALGFVGTGILVVAFILNVSGRLPVGVTYAALNAIGAGFAAYASYLIGFVPFVILECVWCGAAIAKLVMIHRTARGQS